MTGNGIVQIVFYFVVLVAVAIPLGAYMARVYQGEARIARKLLGPLERLTYKAAGVRESDVSAASGIAVLIAVIRGFTRQQVDGIGNFWTDLTKATLYILLPLSIVLALFLVTQGVVQTFDAYPTAHLLDPTVNGDGQAVADQVIALGPAASQIAIKQLGTNGGGFFNVNSAHPFENPTALSNFFEMLSILLISGALCFTLGRLVKDKRQGRALLVAMLVLLVPFVFLSAAV